MALQLCRICGNKEDLLDILEQGPAMLEKLSKCANIDIKEDDFLPKLICQQCDRMLNMSYQLRRQSQTMQEKLQQELTRQEDTEVHYISDDEITKGECERNEENTNTASHAVLGHEEEVTQASAISNVQEFMTIDHETFDTKTQSTILASETEDIIEIDEALKSTNQSDTTIRSFRPVSVEDIESNESCDVAMTKIFDPTITPEKIISEVDVPVDEVVDIGDMNDEFMQDCHNTSTNSQFGSPLQYCSIDLVSNPGTPTPDIDHEEFEADSHSSSTPYTCVTCNDAFIRKKDYHDHIQQHGTSRYQCIQCLAYFPTRYRLVRHESTHNDSAFYDCPYCKRQFTAGYNLQKHVKACHSKRGKYHCDICELSYARQDVLKRHVLQIHTNKKWHCKACGESFRSASFLNAHKSKSDCINPSSISNTTKPTQLLTPLPPEYIVLVSDNRYKCIHCNALFKTLSTYRNHLLIHQDIRPFPCTTCPKTFRTRYALVNHERIHSNERPFKCEICTRSFRQVTHLKHHRYQHMKDDMPFNCTTCQLGFVTKWKLREHLRKHFTEKAFKCAECPEGFFLKYDLKRHARLVHYRSVDIVDSDNEGNQNNQLDFTEGTTETDKTDDERNMDREMDEEEEDVIDIIDDDDDEQNDGPSSNSMNENLLVLNEAEPPSPGDVREVTKESNGNLSETIVDFNHLDDQEATQPSFPTDINIHSEDANEPQVLFINFAEDELTPDDINKTTPADKQTIVDFIDLDEGPSVLLAQPPNVQLNVDNSAGITNETDTNIIHLDDEEEEDEFTSLPPEAANIVAVNETPMDFMHYNQDEFKPQFSSSENQETCDKSNAPGVSNEKVIDYIHLDSSNSCKSPPRYFNNEYFDNVIEGEEQEEYHTITEEKIQITEEKIETFTSFFNLEDMAQS